MLHDSCMRPACLYPLPTAVCRLQCAPEQTAGFELTPTFALLDVRMPRLSVREYAPLKICSQGEAEGLLRESPFSCKTQEVPDRTFSISSILPCYCAAIIIIIMIAHLVLLTHLIRG